RDGDGRVTLEEAYRYVYGRTVESTLATAAGPQHPTYAYDLQGQGELVLTWTTRSGGTLRLAAGDYLVINEASGAIVAEVPAATATQLSLPAGEYRVRQRTRDAVRSGRVVVEAGRETAADPALTEELALARLVRKGGTVAFLEPNPWNLLYYLQILFTPRMTFEGDGGIVEMRRGRIRRASERAGLVDFRLERFGFFPPRLANRPWGQRWERRFESFPPFAGVLPFQLFGARRP
ncbi:MAG: hypothetical protein KDD47_09105, partial [Acidobacteria bacterium]|nr:hypothetical protein [Acidobacteriota bacterium]